MNKSINKDKFLAYQEECAKNAHSSDTSGRPAMGRKYKYYYFKTNYEATVMELIQDGYSVTQIHGYLKSKGIIIGLNTLYKYIELSISSPSPAVPGRENPAPPQGGEL